MKKIILKCKEIDLTYHPGNNNRRVKYNEKDFEILLIRFSIEDKELLYAIRATDLPDTDSIHLRYDPICQYVSFSPKDLEKHIRDVTGLL